MSTYNIPEAYLIAALETKKGITKTVFYAMDNQSGYPYWTSYVSSARDFSEEDLNDKALRALEEANTASYMVRESISHVALIKVVSECVDIDDEQIEERKVKAALDKLTNEEKYLLGLGGK